MTVAGRTAVVTGAATGIGRRVAQLLAERGAAVIAAGLQPERLGETVDAIAAAKRWRSTLTCRIRARSRRSPRAQDAFGGADVLVNNAQIYPIGRWHEADAAQWDAVFATNVRSCFLMARALREQMIGRGGGSIVNVASVTFFSGEPLLLSYVASKGAVIGFTRALSREAGPDGIRVNAVARAIAFFAGDDSRFITGQTLLVDGGLMLD